MGIEPQSDASSSSLEMLLERPAQDGWNCVCEYIHSYAHTHTPLLTPLYSLPSLYPQLFPLPLSQPKKGPVL